MTIIDECDSFINCTENKDDDINIIPKYSLLIIPNSVLLLSLIGLNIWLILKPLLTNKKMDKFLNPTHPVRCMITGSRECGETNFLTNLILYNINDFGEIYIYSPSLRQ